MTKVNKTAAKKKTGNKVVKIKGTVMWAFLDKPNDLSGKYQIDICQLSSAAVEALEGLDIDIKYREDQPEKGKFITCKSARPIAAFDEDGDKISVPVGNGSKVTASITTYEWTFKNKTGVSPSLKKLVVTDLVEYDADGDDEDDDDEAF